MSNILMTARGFKSLPAKGERFTEAENAKQSFRLTANSGTTD